MNPTREEIAHAMKHDLDIFPKSMTDREDRRMAGAMRERSLSAKPKTQAASSGKKSWGEGMKRTGASAKSNRSLDSYFAKMNAKIGKPRDT